MLVSSFHLLEGAAARHVLRGPAWILSALVILLVTGCDRPGLGEGPGAIIGSWTFDRQTIETYLTVDEQQTILDPMRAGDGHLTLNGAEEAVLTHMRWGITSSGTRSLLVSGQPVSEIAFDFRITGGTPILEVPGGSSHARLYADQHRYEAASDEEIDVQRVGASRRISAGRAPFVSGGDTILVDGALTGATRTLPAGEQEHLSTVGIEEQAPRTFRFEPDSTLLIVSAQGDTTRNRWRLENGRLVMVFGAESRARAYQFTYHVREDDMLLRTRFDCMGEERSDCFGAPARVYGVDEETITGIEQQFELRFVPAEGEQSAVRRNNPGQRLTPTEPGRWLGRLGRLLRSD